MDKPLYDHVIDNSIYFTAEGKLGDGWKFWLQAGKALDDQQFYYDPEVKDFPVLTYGVREYTLPIGQENHIHMKGRNKSLLQGFVTEENGSFILNIIYRNDMAG